MYSQDGYKLVRAEELAAALAAFSNRQITFRAFRAFVGCLELLAIREAAERSKPRYARPQKRCFLRSELETLLRLPEGVTLSRELHRLRVTGLVRFSEGSIELASGAGDSADLRLLCGSRGGKRLIPVPRRMIRFLAQCSRPALARTIVAYLLRGLSLDAAGRIKGAGTVKISWICRACRISERAAQVARAALIQMGWITKDTGSLQRKLNRDGAYFVIDPLWARTQSAPRRTEKCARSAPPREKQETPSGSKDQKGASARTGVQTERSSEPTLRDIKPEDLRKPERLEKLYRQAVRAGWITDSEANVRNFICAALRATRSGGRVGAIFAGIVRKALWHYITQEQESRALLVFNRYRERRPSAFSIADSAEDDPTVGELAELIRVPLAKSDRLSSFHPKLGEAETREVLRRQLATEGSKGCERNKSSYRQLTARRRVP